MLLKWGKKIIRYLAHQTASDKFSKS